VRGNGGNSETDCNGGSICINNLGQLQIFLEIPFDLETMHFITEMFFVLMCRGCAVAQLVEAVTYMREGGGFNSR
jgi:hypothetical protein